MSYQCKNSYDDGLMFEIEAADQQPDMCIKFIYIDTIFWWRSWAVCLDPIIVAHYQLLCLPCVHNSVHVIADVHVCNTLGVVNEMGSNRCPEIFKKYFKIKTNHYDLRTKNQMVIPPSRISLGDQAVRIKGASMWNKLDKDLLKYRFKTTLKQHLTQHYLNKY